MTPVVPAELSARLAGYQREGVRWMLEKLSGPSGACVLADEPGLGKTVQAIATIVALADCGLARRILVLAPANVVGVWKAEFEKFADGVRVEVAAVAGKSGGVSALATAVRLFERLGAVGDDGDDDEVLVAVMSYEQMRAHSDDFVAGGAVLDLVVFDEAHRLKDSLSVTARATASLTTRRRLLLTATPVSNCLEELRALLSLVEPESFARTRGLDCFEALFGASIAAGRRDGASKAACLAGDVAETLLREKLANSLLRRGVDVLAGELPARTTYVVVVRPTRLQSASSRVHDLVRA